MSVPSVALPSLEVVLLRRLLRVIASMASNVDPSARVRGRIKLHRSRARKARRCGDGIVLDNIGIRVVLGEVDHCYQLVDSVHARFSSIAAEYDDYILAPKPNGYRSLHTTLLLFDGRTAELQVRTHRMHAVAQTGPAAHWRYKQLQQLDAPAERIVVPDCGPARAVMALAPRSGNSMTHATQVVSHDHRTQQ